jgi:hypothetical protein
MLIPNPTILNLSAILLLFSLKTRLEFNSLVKTKSSWLMLLPSHLSRSWKKLTLFQLKEKGESNL